MAKFYVYEHWRPDRDECFYVGKGHGPRANKMNNRNLFHKAIQNKLSRLGMAVEVKMVATGLCEAEAFEMEVSRIAVWRDLGVDLANITDGGEGTVGIAAYNRRAVLCLETGEIFPSATHAAEAIGTTNIVMSDVCRGKYRLIGGYHYIYSDIETPYEKRMSMIREIEDAQAKRRKRVAVNKNYRGVVDGLDKSGRKASGPITNSRRVVCLDDGSIFPSASSASRHYNIAKSAIIELCLGRNGLRTVGGHKFKYEDV